MLLIYEYYQKLYTEPRVNDQDEFAKDIDSYLSNVFGGPPLSTELTGGPITVKDTVKQISKMKVKKAHGWDNISAEHLKHSGTTTLASIIWLMNEMISAEILPQHYKRGLIVPIPKARKDPTVKDNNRGITLLSVLYKLLEMIILEREKEWLERNNVIDELQGAGQDKCSSLHVSMLLQEAISYNRNKGNSVYIAFLDKRKAFDTVWVPGLLFKLSQLGMNRKALHFVSEDYKNFQCSVMIDGSWDSGFLPERGVHQGPPLSMRLYQVYVNELLQRLKSNTHGLMIDDIKVTCPSFADDIATGALYKGGLNSHLALAHDYSKMALRIQPLKVSVDVVRRGYGSKHRFKTGDRILQQVNSYKHMGITLCNDAALERQSYAESIGEARSSLLAARGIGSSGVPVPASILSKIYWSVSMPRLTYGLEVKTAYETALYDLERAHRQNAKLVQIYPRTL